jgi:predicted anti-sigma-YlaC factor YlaD
VPSEANNTTDEFSPVLRRYLREQRSLECSGFDADLASAYLEQSLTPFSRHQYEDHLNGCPACRGHLFQLANLVDLTPAIDLPGRVAPEVSSAPRVAEAVREWIGRLRELFVAPVRMPAVAVALTVTALVAGVIAWQFRPTKQDPSGELAAATSPKPTTGESLTEGTTGGATVSEGEKTGPLTNSAPGSSPAARITAPATSVAPPAANGETTIAEAVAAAQNLPSAPNIASGIDLLGETRPDLETRPVSGGSIAINTRPVSQPKVAKSERGDDSVAFQVPDIQALRGFVSPRSRRAASTAETGNIRVIGDKTFILEGRTWVDQEFHQLMRSSGSVTLIHGDETHERLVAENPALAEFFTLRPVTVVWKGRVYRVLAR